MARRVGFIVFFGLLLVVGIPRPAAAGTRGELVLEVSQGFDSNPLDLNPEVLPSWGESPRGAYTQLGLNARLAHQWSPRVGYFVSARGQGRLHPSYLDDAENAEGRAEAGLGFVLFARNETRLSAALRASYGLERSTFVDPGTGEAYVVIIDPNTPLLALAPDRFNVDTTTGHLDLRLRTSRRLLLMLDMAYSRQDYREDYEELLVLQSLDDRTLSVRPGLRWQISDRVRLDVTADWGERRYDGLSALEEDATPADDELRRYRSAGLRTAMRVQPSESWSFTFGLGGSERQDLHAGYYDSTGTSAFASAGWAATPSMRLGLHVIQSIYDYDRATIDGLPNGERRGGDVLRAATSLERDLGSHLTVFGEAGAIRASNQDPQFTYDRNWAQAGLRFKL